MQRYLKFAPAGFLLMLAIAAAWGGAAGVKAAYPQSPGQPAPSASADPYHHISGVVLFPPDRMRSSQAGSAGPLSLSLLPPVFGPNVDASLNDPAAQNETTIAINPEDTQRIIASANDYRTNLKPWVYLSTNGGTNWTNYQVPGAGNSLYYGDPAMTFGEGGKAYFGYLGYQSVCGGAGGMYVSRTTDAGATFSPPLQLAANSNDGTTAVLEDKEYVAVDNQPLSPYRGNVYEGWTKFVFHAGSGCGGTQSQITAPTMFSRSTDAGVNWSVPITASQPISDNNQGTVPVVGRHGEVYLYYLGAQTQSQTNYDTVLFSRSTDGGQTFPFFTHIASIVDLPSPLPHTQFRDNAFGAMAADQVVDNYLYAVWADYRTGDADILFSRSTDNGNTWGPPQRVNDDPVANGKDQFFPWITTAPDGAIHIGWFDRREDPNDANYKEYYTYSTDQGATFAPNVTVSTAPSVPSNSGFIGDYSGIASATNVVIPCWTDIRSGGNQNAYIARGDYGPGVETPTPTSTPSPTPVLPTITPTATSTDTQVPTGTATASPTATGTPCAITFTDVHPTDYFYEAVTYLYCHGVISGYADNTFRPYNNTTRGQMSKIVVLGFGIPIWTPSPSATPTFSDVPPDNAFYQYVETAAHNNIVSGYADGTFRPFANVTRGQLSKIIVVGATIVNGWPLLNPPTPTFSDVPANSPFYTYIETAYCHQIISGYADGSFHPNADATRGQISKIQYLAILNQASCAVTPTATP